MTGDLDTFDFQGWLDTVTGFFMDDDFGSFADTVALPAIVTTAEGASVLSTIEDLRGRFDFWMHFMKAQQATDMIRTARSYDRIGSEVCRGKYETELLRGGTRIIKPFTSEVILRRQDGVWRTTFVEHLLTKQFWKMSS
ncbi:MAG: hypothetical protein ABJN34_15175 [Litoreibacter sp.]|uniref:hypothetical protein n=1 Tax=Litoreibacter sp. TaxID=1969459 RepID=UPI003296CC46